MSSKDKKEKWLALASFFANMGAGLGQGGPGGAWGERIAGQISNQAQAIAAQRAKEEADKKAKRGFLGKIAGTVVGRIPVVGDIAGPLVEQGIAGSGGSGQAAPSAAGSMAMGAPKAETPIAPPAMASAPPPAPTVSPPPAYNPGSTALNWDMNKRADIPVMEAVDVPSVAAPAAPTPVRPMPRRSTPITPPSSVLPEARPIPVPTISPTQPVVAIPDPAPIAPAATADPTLSSFSATNLTSGILPASTGYTYVNGKLVPRQPTCIGGNCGGQW